MEGAAAAVVFGAVMMIVGLTRGLWQELVDSLVTGLSNFSAALRGDPADTHRQVEFTPKREPLVALIGLALTLLGVLAQLQG